MTASHVGSETSSTQTAASGAAELQQRLVVDGALLGRPVEARLRAEAVVGGQRRPATHNWRAADALDGGGWKETTCRSKAGGERASEPVGNLHSRNLRGTHARGVFIAKHETP